MVQTDYWIIKCKNNLVKNKCNYFLINWNSRAAWFIPFPYWTGYNTNEHFSVTFIHNAHTAHMIDVTYAQSSRLKKQILVQMLIESETLFFYNLKWKNNE